MSLNGSSNCRYSPTIQETAYPRLKSVVSARDLASIYTPTPNELALAEQSTRGEGSHLSFLILLKTFQRLGYFPLLSQVPPAIVEHIATLTQTQAALPELAGYDLSGTRKRHLQIICQALHIQIFGREARHAMLLAMSEAARTKEDLADLINVAIEELVRKKYELPAFDTLLRAARHVRTVVYHQFYRHVEATLTPEEQACIDALFVAEPDTRFTPWNTLKQEPGSPTLTHLKTLAGSTGLAGTVPDRREGTRRHSGCQGLTLRRRSAHPRRGPHVGECGSYED